ncbi:MAG: peptide-binding protein [Comamonadaceae bacterium]|nr:MAG: peptide-binding protein [Comamonadaceae bacterium]
MPGIRRLSPVVLLASLVLAMMWSSVAQARAMVSIARENVNMRAGAGTRSEALWGLSRGYPLEVVGRRGNWLRVSDFERDKGWVLRSLTSRTPHHVVKARVANLRAAPTARSRIVGKALHGEVLRTLGKRSGWVQVRDTGGRSGWVASRLLWGW